MKNKILLLILFQFTVYQLFTLTVSHAGVSNTFYAHYVGTLNDNQNVDVNIQKSNDTIIGNYWKELAIIPIRLRGNMKNKFDFELFEFDINGNQTGSFEGTFDISGKVSGTWYNTDRTLEMPFEWIENTEKLIKFEVFDINRCNHFFENEDYPSITMWMQYVHPIEFQNAEVLTKLQIDFENFFFGKNAFRNHSKVNLSRLSDSIISNYRANETDFDTLDASNYMWNWIVMRSIEIFQNSENMLAFSVNEYNYNGGGHGTGGTTFYTIDLQSGSHVLLTDIFEGSFYEKLGKLITSQLKINYEIPDFDPLTEAGFFQDNIDATENFYVTPAGIAFHYNPYEIASYANGEIEVFLTFEQLQDILKSESPISQYFQKN